MAAKKVSVKKRKKVWCTILAPESLNKAVLGETNVYSSDEAVGKTLNLNLAMVLNDMKKQNSIVSFRVAKIADGKALTEIYNYSLTNAYIKRLVKRKKDKIDDSFLVKDKNGVIVRIKPVLITNAKTHESAISKIRMNLRVIIRKLFKEYSFEEFLIGVVNMRFQKGWRDALSKIYPLKYVDIRFAGLELKAKNFKEDVIEEVLEEPVSEDVNDVDDVDESKSKKESKKKPVKDSKEHKEESLDVGEDVESLEDVDDFDSESLELDEELEK